MPPADPLCRVREGATLPSYRIFDGNRLNVVVRSPAVNRTARVVRVASTWLVE